MLKRTHWKRWWSVFLLINTHVRKHARTHKAYWKIGLRWNGYLRSHLPFNTRRKAKVISFFNSYFLFIFILIDGPIIKYFIDMKGTVFIFTIFFLLFIILVDLFVLLIYINFLLLFSSTKEILHSLTRSTISFCVLFGQRLDLWQAAKR